MRRSIILATLVTLLSCASVWAQTESPSDEVSLGSVDMPSGIEATPEVWMYLHEYKRYKDPKEAVRAKAILRAKQRQARIESQKWYGHSKSRPNANAMPQMSVHYGQQWGGLAWSPNLWTPYATYYHYNRAGTGRSARV